MAAGGLVGAHGILGVSEWEMGEGRPSFPITSCRGSGSEEAEG